jgi:selenocysteine-specific elongation factor
LLQAWIERLRQQGVIEPRGAGHALAASRPRLDAEASRHWQSIESELSASGLRPLTAEEIAQATGLAPAQLKPLLQTLLRDGRLVRLSAKLLLLPQSLRELQSLVLRLQQRAGEGEFSVAEFRDASGIGRNRCIEILESFDARGITRRGEHGRRLLPAADGAFARLQASAV